MYNNDYHYLEEIIDGGDIGMVLENRPEDHSAVVSAGIQEPGHAFKQGRVDSLVWAYRDIGHLHANLNPLGESYAKDYTRLPEFRDGSYHQLTLEEFGLSASDLDTEFFGGKYIGGAMTLREIVKRFSLTYCTWVGVEFLHIQNRRIREWLMERMESGNNTTSFSREQKRIILTDLLHTEEMENMLHRTFLGQTRFSIQGAEVLIPALHFLADRAHRYGIEEIVMGTSHRGRLSILSTVLNQPPEAMFHLFEENYLPGIPGGSGDVRYHIGKCTRHRNDDGTSVNITLLPNSSQLESVDAIVEGNARGLQDARRTANGAAVLPVLVHGDASFAAQGVVAETFNLSRLPGFTTGGSIHIVINNQIGFTTGALHGHSGLNPTDVAKMLPIPVFHVNGDHPESVVHALVLAMDYRQEFHRDVVVDIYCYRRFGHNEGDEPVYTQPQMYALIRDHESVVSLYRKDCVADGTASEMEIEAIRREYREKLSAALAQERGGNHGRTYAPVMPADEETAAATGVEEKALAAVMERMTEVPRGFAIQPRLAKINENNRRKFLEDRKVTWAMAESLAFGTILAEGTSVRISGQDVARGTFSQRHLVWWESEREGCCSHSPLAGLAAGNAQFSVINSPLSEYSVLAFEYGYATARGDSLVIWEAQYGDFVNGAQIIVDSYIAAGRSKWSIRNGLVVLLPHGYEGMGPEHSSGHLERFLQLCAGGNMRVCNPTTPAQYFHLLRDQRNNASGSPLVIMTPKSMLRHPRAESSLEELQGGRFRALIEDPPSGDCRRVILCTGKIHYDLTGSTHGRESVAIIRIERLHPFPGKDLAAILDTYKGAGEICWVQEETRNRGAWHYIREAFDVHFPDVRLRYIGREAAPSPATGSLQQHNEEQADIIARALNGDAGERVIK